MAASLRSRLDSRPAVPREHHFDQPKACRPSTKRKASRILLMVSRWLRGRRRDDRLRQSPRHPCRLTIYYNFPSPHGAFRPPSACDTRPRSSRGYAPARVPREVAWYFTDVASPQSLKTDLQPCGVQASIPARAGAMANVSSTNGEPLRLGKRCRQCVYAPAARGYRPQPETTVRYAREQFHPLRRHYP